MTTTQPTPWRRADTTWFKNCRWGLLGCFLADTASNLQPIALTPDEWNRRVDAFDVAGLAAQLAAARVPYFILTLGQNSGFYLSPNATYDSIVGYPASHCSRRDLIAELAAALAPHGIHLLVYLPGSAPANDALAKAKLEGVDDARHTTLQRNWEAICREWSLRWGKAVSGWWIDGPYDAPAYQHADEPNYRSFAAALKAGNPDAIVTFNHGCRNPLYSMTEYEDYTPGEVDRELPLSSGYVPGASQLAAYPEFINGARLHVLTILGEWWGQGPARLPEALVVGYTQFINARGGVVTWDVPLTPTGLIAPAFLPHLTALGTTLPKV